MRKSDLEKYLVARVKELGGEVRKVQWIGRRGAPDRLVMIHNHLRYACPTCHSHGFAVWVELKTPTATQLREHERMRKMGQRVVVVDSVEGVEELLR